MAGKQAVMEKSPAEGRGRRGQEGEAASWGDRWLRGSWHDGTYHVLDGGEERAQVAPVGVELAEVSRGLGGHQGGAVALFIERPVADGGAVVGELVGELLLSDAEAQALALALLARVPGRVVSSFADRGNTHSLRVPPALR